jgi:hypothetical protein
MFLRKINTLVPGTVKLLQPIKKRKNGRLDLKPSADES